MKSGKMLTEKGGGLREVGEVTRYLAIDLLRESKCEVNQDQYMFWAPEGKELPFTEIENPRGVYLKVRIRS